MMSKVSPSEDRVKKTLLEFIPLIENDLEILIKEKENNVDKNFNEFARTTLDNYSTVLTSKGKRLRAFLAFNTYKMFGGEDDATAIRLGSIIEMIHAYLLVLDDFADKSEKRRNESTAHIKFRNFAKEVTTKDLDSVHLGNALASHSGSNGFHIAMQFLASLNTTDKIKLNLIKEINEKIEYTCYGQINDILNPIFDSVSEQQVMNVLRWKTGIYTYENPIHSGAILAGVTDEKTFEDLSQIAIPSGIVFQIVDDIIGVFGDDKTTGKSSLDDIKEGKYTLLVHKVFENGTETQKSQLKKYLGNENLTSKDLEMVKEIMIETKSLDYSKNLANELTSKSLKFLKKVRKENWIPKYTKNLIGLIELMPKRVK